MRNSCVVVFFAVAVCLVICVSASTAVSKEDEAKAAVKDAQDTVKTVCDKAKNQLDNAQSLLDKVEAAKSEAEDAVSKSQKAAKDNTEAKAIANTTKSLSDAVDILYATEKQKLDTAIDRLTTLQSEAEKLNGKTDITIAPDTEGKDEYTETNGKAATLKVEAAELEGNITEALTLFSGVDTTAKEMEKNAKEAQLAHSHVSAIVAVAKIVTILGKADTLIPQIEGNRSAVSGIVEQMQTLKQNFPAVSDNNIEALQRSAADALTAATGAVQNAKSARTAIQTQKDHANAALAKVTEEKQDVRNAKGEVQKTEDCVRAAEEIVPQLNIALQTATISVTKANDSKQKMEKALSKTTSEQSTQQNKEKENGNLSVVGGRDSHTKDTTIQLTSKNSLSKIDNSAGKLKDTLSNGAQNVSTTALTGGKAPAPGANNDSAMTVSVPLLVALIASAVLQ